MVYRKKTYGRKYPRKTGKVRTKASIKRRPRRYKSSNTKLQSIPRAGYIRSFPDQVRVKLHYNCTYTFSGSASVSCTMRGDSPYDPEFAIGGGQPTNFDAYATTYYMYNCTSSSIKCRCLGASGQQLRLVIYPSVASGAHAFNTSTAVPGMRQRLIAGGDTTSGYLQNYSTSAKQNGVRFSQYDSHCGVGGDPTVGNWFWIILGESLDGATSLDWTLTFDLTYYVTFMNRKLVPDT